MLSGKRTEKIIFLFLRWRNFFLLSSICASFGVNLRWLLFCFGTKATKLYKVIHLITILLGALLTSSLAWDISDTFNGLMMIPNLIGVLACSGIVLKITNNYRRRKLAENKEDIEPMLSAFPEIQAEQVQAMKNDGEL